MDDNTDLEKMIEVLNKCKTETFEEFENEEFIECEESDVEDIPNEEEDVNFSEVFVNCTIDLNKYDPVSSLKPEEKLLINSCKDPDLKRLLILNRTKNMQLIELYKKMKDALICCRDNIIKLNELSKKPKESRSEAFCQSRTWRLGAPYFKDAQNYAAPPNADVTKKGGKELRTYDLTPFAKWTSFECDRLLKAVKVNYNINKQNEIVKQIRELKGYQNVAKGKYDVELHRSLKEQLQILKDDEDYKNIPPLYSDNCIDWNRIADVFLKEKHTEFECRTFWNIYVHPSINKSHWTPDENAKLEILVSKYNFQRWDVIARELGTNRSALTACTNFYNNLYDRIKLKKGEFSLDEDKKLIELVHRYKLGNYIPWARIAQHFKNRMRSQLHHRYTYYLCEDKITGKFTDAEDVMLMVCVDRFGKNFRKCRQYIPTRTPTQLKARFNTNLQCPLRKGSFTKEEDEMIMKYVKIFGTKRWTQLSKDLERSRGQLRQRHQTICYFLQSNPGATVKQAPRRKHCMQEQEQQYEFQRSVADSFKSKRHIPTMAEVEEALEGFSKRRKRRLVAEADSSVDEEESKYDIKPVVMDEPEDEAPDSKTVDSLLTDFFCYHRDVPQTRDPSEEDVAEAVENVESILDTLKADLDIPEDLDAYICLDGADKAILRELRRRETGAGHDRSVSSLVPASLDTLTGFKGVLSKYKYSLKWNRSFLNFSLDMKNPHARYKRVSNRQILKQPPEQQDLIEADRNLFLRRLISLFKWPALMTLEDASPEVQNVSGSLQRLKEPVKRTYSRASNDRAGSGEVDAKRVRTDISAGNVPHVLRLTPVTNKSVLEDLFKDRSKKLYALDRRSGGAALVREMKLSFVKSEASDSVVRLRFAEGPSQASGESEREKEVGGCGVGDILVDLAQDMEDIADLERLQNFLKLNECKTEGVD